MLAGSKSAKLKKFRLDQLSTFGRLRLLTQPEILQFLDALQQQGLVVQMEVERFRPILQLTSLGADVMRERAPLPRALDVPDSLLAKLMLSGRRTEEKQVPPQSEKTAENSVLAGPHASPQRDEIDDNSATGPMSEGRPAYYWTWRLLAAGFRPNECGSIRQLPLADIYRHAVDAVQHGLDVEPRWLFTDDEVAALQQTASADADQSADPLVAAQVAAFQACLRNVEPPSTSVAPARAHH
jgi:hypothetical protein